MKEETFEASQLSYEEDWFGLLAEATSAALVIYCRQGILFANRAMEEICGMALADLRQLEDPWQVVAPHSRDELRSRHRVWSEGSSDGQRFKMQLRHISGEERWVKVVAHPIFCHGEPATIATIIEVVPQRRGETSPGRDRELTQVALGAIDEGVIRTDRAGCIDYMNPVAERLTGWLLQEAKGKPLDQVYPVMHESTRKARPAPLELSLREGRTVAQPGVWILRSRDGEEFTVRDSIAPLVDAQEKVIGAVVVIRDLTRLRGLEQQMSYLASHDTLTGLLNRQELEIHLEVALEGARERHLGHSLIYLDVVELKLVNDAYGIVAGDELLRQVADLLQAAIGDLGILGRVAGNDFALLLEECQESEARAMAREILRRLRDFRFTWGGHHLEIGLSIGLVTFDWNCDSVHQLLKQADAACHLARQNGRNQIYTYGTDAALSERYGRLHWVQKIHRALMEDRFCLYHQEIRPLRPETGPSLHEMLVRMLDDDGSHVLPSSFIPIAESHDLAPVLDRWVIRNTLRLLAIDTYAPLRGAPVTINLSGQSLGDEAFRQDVMTYIETSGVDPSRLYFEITETAAVANLVRALRFIEVLKGLGCRFILDDFGSGFSSFAYLKNLPVEILKIDGQFVRSVGNDPVHRAMVGAVSHIGRVMGLATIAEWVEDDSTLDLLEDLGVDYVQGFHIHRPEMVVVDEASDAIVVTQA